MGDVPLSGLLARALGDLTLEFSASGAGSEGIPSAPMWFGVLRAFPAEGAVVQRDLPSLTCLSKRAVRQMVGAATRSGWIEVVTGGGVHATLRFSPLGRVAARTWAELGHTTEQRWCHRVGADLGLLQHSLATLVAQLDLELPHYPISYGSADVSVTGGRSRSTQLGPPRIPAHGDDWAPVIRDKGASPSELGLTALLSQLLVAFSIDYAEAGGGAVVLAEALARGFGIDDVAALENLPAVLGVNGNGKSRLERHGVVSVHSDPKDERTQIARLSKFGRQARDLYSVLVRDIESDWSARFSRPSVATVRQLLQEILPGLRPELPDALMATYVRC